MSLGAFVSNSTEPPAPGERLLVGPPQASPAYSAEQLAALGLVGLYRPAPREA